MVPLLIRIHLLLHFSITGHTSLLTSSALSPAFLSSILFTPAKCDFRSASTLLAARSSFNADFLPRLSSSRPERVSWSSASRASIFCLSDSREASRASRSLV
ncbi:hypothetical protein PENTCL1PPCAC_20199, partial [Pristionchus entomophagus]